MFLVVFVTAAGGGLRDWIVAQADQLNGADLSVSTTTGGIPTDLQHRIESTPGVAVVDGGSTTRSARSGSDRPAASGDFGDRVSAGDFAQVGKVLDAETEQGDLATLRDDQVAYTNNDFGGGGGGRGAFLPQLGSPVQITFKNGVTRQFTIGAIIKRNFDLGGYLVSSKAALAADPQLLRQQDLDQRRVRAARPRSRPGSRTRPRRTRPSPCSPATSSPSS